MSSEEFPTNKRRPGSPSPMTQVLQTGAAPITELAKKAPPEVKSNFSKKLEQILMNAFDQVLATFDDVETDERLSKARAVSPNGEELGDEHLDKINKRVVKLSKKAKNRTAAASTVTGAMGAVGQIADIPAFYLYAVRTMTDIAIHHGFDPRIERERRFLLQLLRIGHIAGYNNREQALDELASKDLYGDMSMLDEVSYAMSGRGIALAVRPIAKLLLKRKLGASIPIIGGVINAGLNWHLMGVILTTTRRGFQGRALRQRPLLSNPS